MCYDLAQAFIVIFFILNQTLFLQPFHAQELKIFEVGIGWRGCFLFVYLLCFSVEALVDNNVVDSCNIYKLPFAELQGPLSFYFYHGWSFSAFVFDVPLLLFWNKCQCGLFPGCQVVILMEVNVVVY